MGFFSPEISANTLGYRFDSASAAFSNKALLRGEMIPNYDKYIEELKSSDGHFYVVELKDFNNEATVDKLRYFCKSKHIQILFIDGFDYLTDTRAKKFHSREDRMGHIAQDLVSLSIELEIPVVGVIQANRKSTESEEMGTENITGSDKIGASCTRLITLKSTGPAMEISVPKNRYGVDKVKVLYQWDADRSNFFYIPELGQIDEEEVKEVKDSFGNMF